MNKIDQLISILKDIYHLLKLFPQYVTGNGHFTVPEEELMTRQQVKDYLGISEATYKRKVKDGELKPMRMPGGDRFFKSQLLAAYQESRRRGRI